MSQRDIFLEGEGDAWFIRNSKNLSSLDNVKNGVEISFILSELLPFKDCIHEVLEIGCGNAIKLEVLCNELNAVGSGLDPSVKAINNGNDRKKDTELRLFVGSADFLPFDTDSFDVVFFSFCLYLVDRSFLLKTLSEADRVLRPGGFLCITDFDVPVPLKRGYVHAPQVFSFKNDYTRFFCQNGLYSLFAKKSFSHSYPFFSKEVSERVSTSLVFKEIDPFSI